MPEMQNLWLKSCEDFGKKSKNINLSKVLAAFILLVGCGVFAAGCGDDRGGVELLYLLLAVCSEDLVK